MLDDHPMLLLSFLLCATAGGVYTQDEKKQSATKMTTERKAQARLEMFRPCLLPSDQGSPYPYRQHRFVSPGLSQLTVVELPRWKTRQRPRRDGAGGKKVVHASLREWQPRVAGREVKQNGTVADIFGQERDKEILDEECETGNRASNKVGRGEREVRNVDRPSTKHHDDQANTQRSFRVLVAPNAVKGGHNLWLEVYNRAEESLKRVLSYATG